MAATAAAVRHYVMPGTDLVACSREVLSSTVPTSRNVLTVTCRSCLTIIATLQSARRAKSPEPVVRGPNALGLTTQVVNSLRQRIDTGVFEVGAILPSSAEMSQKYGVSHNVVRRALSVLRSEGLVEIAQGRPPIVIRRSGDLNHLGLSSEGAIVLAAIDRMADGLSALQRDLSAMRISYVNGITGGSLTTGHEED